MSSQMVDWRWSKQWDWGGLAQLTHLCIDDLQFPWRVARLGIRRSHESHQGGTEQHLHDAGCPLVICC